MNKSETTKLLFTALSKAQSEMKAVGFDAVNPFLKNKYATLGALIEAARPILARHGLAIVQMPVNEGNLVGVETMITHESGEYVSNRFVMPMGDEKGKSLAQVAGSIITYQRRYALGAFLNAYGDEDTDGHSAPTPAKTVAMPPKRPVEASEAPEPSNHTPAPAEAVEGGWRSVEVTFGKNKGKKLGELAPKSVEWYSENFKVEETWTDKEGNKRDTKPEKLALDTRLRAALDEAMREFYPAGSPNEVPF
jgi:hypothetical protein